MSNWNRWYVLPLFLAEWARSFFKRLLCRHSGGISFVRNVYGDEILERDGKRSLWCCKRCGSVFAMDALNKEPGQ
jgi:hypothetical protein